MKGSGRGQKSPQILPRGVTANDRQKCRAPLRADAGLTPGTENLQKPKENHTFGHQDLEPGSENLQKPKENNTFATTGH